MSKIKIGLIVDDFFVSKQIYELVLFSKSSKCYEISHLIIQKTENRYSKNFIGKIFKYIYKRGIKKFLENVCFLILFHLEKFFTKKIYPQFQTIFDTYNLNDFSLKHLYVEPNFSKSTLVYRYKDKDLKIIKSLGLNLLVRGGSGILRGEILEICKNGVISSHLADNNINRGGPVGFWEVFKKEKRTGFIIQRLNEELDGGEVLFKGYIPTSFYYTLNLAMIYTKSNPFLHKTIEKIITTPSEIKTYPKKKYVHALYSSPSLYTQIKYLISTLTILFQKIIRKLTKKSYRWGVAYQFVDNWKNISLLSNSKKIPNPSNCFLADPFIWRKDDVYYCFVEKYNYLKKKGCISVFKITKNNCIEIGTALEENFHLSYPFLFSYENELYMCPETHEAKDIRLYKCTEFPLKWELSKILMSGISAADTNIFEKYGKWWLMTNICSSNLSEHSSELHIYSSEQLLSSDWRPNKNNPVLFDPFKARNGGLIIEDENIYRIGQKQGFDFYGESMKLSKITKLKEDEYEEKTLFEIEPRFFKKIEGTHTFNFKDGLSVIDFVKVDRHEVFSK